jgi:thiamine-phosphate pyrophosphorylase
MFKKNKNFLGINKFKLLSKLNRKRYCRAWRHLKAKKTLNHSNLLNQSDFAGISFFK